MTSPEFNCIWAEFKSGRAEDGKWISAATQRYDVQWKDEGTDRKIYSGNGIA